MKAILLEKTGGVENLEFREIPTPTIKETEVLVEIRSLSINPVDVKSRSMGNLLNMFFGSERPVILGWDIAGIVTEVGAKATRFKPGDKVFGMVNFPGAGNAYAEYVASPETHLALIPEKTSFEEAAASTLAALTALQVMKDKIHKGDRVLIHAGSGGVGHFAVQIAHAWGAHVISTSSSKNRDFILSIGANEHIDYREKDFEKELSGINFVYDTLGGETIKKSLEVLAPGGTLVSIAAGGSFEEDVKSRAKEKNITLSPFMVQSSSQDMEIIAEMIAKGQIKPHVSRVFDFDDMAQAHTEVESSRTRGKIVVNIPK